MPLFICENCNAIENTALGDYWSKHIKLCSECARGKWHNRFPKEKFNKKKWRIVDGFVKSINPPY